MNIETLHIKNFRCFAEFTLSFGRRATVLFGKNGTGKTTLIHALRKALSFTMYSETAKSMDTDGNENIVLRSISKGNAYLTVEGFSKMGDYKRVDAPLVEISAEAQIAGGPRLRWAMSAFTSNMRLRPSKFRRAFNDFYLWYEETGQLPLLAYYSDSFPHKEDMSRETAKKKVSSLRNFGYFDWNEEEGCTKEWLGRLERNFKNIYLLRMQNERMHERGSAGQNAALIERNEADIASMERENSMIEARLVHFSQNLGGHNVDTIRIAGIRPHSESGRLGINTPEGEEIEFMHLPSGYRRIFAIALDLAYRSYILSNCCDTELSGIAIIDEIDLHLHPELENIVLDVFLTTFPHVQFIVSTHSINVLTNANPQGGAVKIVRMVKGASAGEPVENIYGLDIKAGQLEVMGARITDDKLESYISQCAYMLSKGLDEGCRRIEEFIIDKGYITQDELQRRIQRKLEEIS